MIDSKGEVSGVLVAADIGCGCVARLLIMDCMLEETVPGVRDIVSPAVTAANDNLVVDDVIFARNAVHDVIACDVDCPVEKLYPTDLDLASKVV